MSDNDAESDKQKEKNQYTKFDLMSKIEELLK